MVLNHSKEQRINYRLKKIAGATRGAPAMGLKAQKAKGKFQSGKQ